MFDKTLTLTALLMLTAGGLSPAHAQAPAAPVAPAAALKVPTEAEARTQFTAIDAARLAAKDGTDERAKAANQAEVFARGIAWDEFDAGNYDEAATWFARRAALEHEYYVNEVAFHETVRKAEADKKVADLVAITHNLATRLSASKDLKRRAILQRVIDGIPQTKYDIKHSYLSSVENWMYLLGDQPKLLEYYRQDVAIEKATLLEMQQAGLPATQTRKMEEAIAKSLEQIGDAQERTAQFDAAEKTYREALALRRSLPEDDAERDIAESLSDLARLYGDQGDLPRARSFYEQALKAIADNQPALKKALAAGPTPEQAGLPQKDVDQSLGVRRQALIINNIESQGVALNNLGTVVQDMGDYKTALDYFERAVAVNGTLPTDGPLIAMLGPNTFAVAKAGTIIKNLSNIAVLHADSGAVDQAIQEVLTILAWDKRLGEKTATDLVNLGDLYSEKGDAEKARLYTEQARREFAADQDLRGVITTTIGLGTLALNAGRLSEAEDDAQQALAVARQTGDLGWLSAATRQMAGVCLKQGRLDEADALLTEAERINAQVGAPLDQENTADLEGRVLEARGKPDAALAKYKAAIDLLERVRATTASAADFSNIKSTYKVYERIVTLLLKLGRTEEAFDYYNRAGSSQLQDSLRKSSLKTHDPALQALLDRIQGLKVQQKTLLAQLQVERAKPLAQQDAAKIQSLLGPIEASRQELFHLVDELKRVNPALYKVVVPFDPETLVRAEAKIPADVALIEYAPLGDQLYIFVATHDGVTHYAASVKSSDLFARIKAVRAQLTTPDSAAPAVRGTEAVSAPDAAPGPLLADNLAALYGMLITPIASEIAAKKTLAFMPTQSLCYLPMQALGYKEGGGLHYLIQDKQIVYLAGTDMLAALDPSPAPRGVGLAAFGNPTGANLPFAQAEVEAISHLFPSATIYAGSQATKAAFEAPPAQAAAILHFATHSMLDATDPSKSYIFLADGGSEAGQLTFDEIRVMQLDKADLVTLSACQTALQGQDPSGTEVASMAQAFFTADVHTVVASLWSVADKSTQTLMVGFYKNLAAGQSKAEALRGAQLTLLHDPHYAHPYYWAPFILMGDWK